MGYIKLAGQVKHVWYSKHLPDYIAILLPKMFDRCGKTS